MKVSELMQHSVLTATPDTTLALAWRLMEDHHIRHLPVVLDSRLVGLVTDRDIRSATPTSALPLADAAITLYMGMTRVEACMTQDVVTMGPEADIKLATRKILDCRFGCIPVVAHNRLVGIITEIDLLRGYLAAAASRQTRLTVKDAMQDLLIMVTPEDRVSTAYYRMQAGRVRHLPIVDDAEKLAGLITDRDIRQAGDFGADTLGEQEPAERFGMMTVNDLMTTSVVTVRNETVLTDAAELFLRHKFGCLPVIRADNTLEGILSVADLLALYLTHA